MPRRFNALVRCSFVAIVALGVAVVAVPGSAAQGAPDVVYDSIGSLPSNMVSVSFNSEPADEFGDLVTLAPGGRELTTVSVALSSQACTTGSGTTTCTTTAGATFDHPLTMTLYNMAGTLAAPTVGSVIATVTDTFTIPLRPSADPVNCTGGNLGRWFDGTACQTGLAVVADFVFPAGTILPDTLIWGVTYNTNLHGPAPIGSPGPYDFLNVGAFTNGPTVGTDVNEDMAFISGPPTGDVFASDPGWTGERPMARIETQAVAAPAAPTTTPATPGEELPATGGFSATTLGLGLAFLAMGTAALAAASARRRALLGYEHHAG